MNRFTLLISSARPLFFAPWTSSKTVTTDTRNSPPGSSASMRATTLGWPRMAAMQTLVSRSLVVTGGSVSFLGRRLVAALRHEVRNADGLQPGAHVRSATIRGFQDYRVALLADAHPVAGEAKILGQPHRLAAPHLEELGFGHGFQFVATIGYTFLISSCPGKVRLAPQDRLRLGRVLGAVAGVKDEGWKKAQGRLAGLDGADQDALGADVGERVD